MSQLKSFEQYYTEICNEHKLHFYIDCFLDFEEPDQDLAALMHRIKSGEEICCFGQFTLCFRTNGSRNAKGSFGSIGWDVYEQDDEGNDTETEVDYFKFESVRDAVRLAVNRAMEPCLQD